MEHIQVTFDVWFSEQQLFDSGDYDTVMAKLDKGAYLVQREGATWFSSTNLGEDKDNVLVRSSGAPTYFASDVAYHYNKFVKRSYDRVNQRRGGGSGRRCGGWSGHGFSNKLVAGCLGTKIMKYCSFAEAGGDYPPGADQGRSLDESGATLGAMSVVSNK